MPGFAIGSLRRRRVSHGALCTVLLLAVDLPVAASQDSQPRVWSRAAAPALLLYRSDDFTGAFQAAAALRSSEASHAARFDGALLEALALLRMPARADRVEGRARLFELAGEDPTVLQDAECQLSLGIALAALAETGPALEWLSLAAEGFEHAAQTTRLGAALLALAETWSLHNEWHETPPRFALRPPASSAAADALRRAQLALIGQRLRSLPGLAETVVQFDLVLAEYYFSQGAVAEAEHLLQQHASADPPTPASARAALRLAQHFVKTDRLAEALTLYGWLSRNAPPEAGRAADRQIHQLARPAVALHIPPDVLPGEPVYPVVRARGCHTLTLEVRQFDLATWLADPQQRGDESTLPTAGSLAYHWSHTVPDAAPYRWFELGSGDDSPHFTLSRGAYVIALSGTDGAGRPVEIKRLLIATPLRPLALTGARHLLFWAPPSGQSSTTPTPLELRFWLQRSLFPTEYSTAGESLRMPIPGYASVYTDKRWLALLQRGTDIALLRGTFDRQRVSGPPVPYAALASAPGLVSAEGRLRLAGQLLPPLGHAELPDLQLDLIATNALDDIVLDLPLLAEPDGIFQFDLPVDAEWERSHLRFTLRQDGRVLPNPLGRVTAAVATSHVSPLRVRVSTPPHSEGFLTPLKGTMTAAYAWGTPAAHLRMDVQVHALHLPESGPPNPGLVAAVLRQADWGDARGRLPFEFSPEALRAAEPEFGSYLTPVAYSLRASANDWSGHQNTWSTHAVHGGDPNGHAWLLRVPTDRPPRQHFIVGWFSVDPVVRQDPAAVTITLDQAVVATLPLRPHEGGLATGPWSPAAPGSYTASMRIERVSGPPLVAEDTFEVAPAVLATPAAQAPQFSAERTFVDGESAVRIRIRDATVGPWLVVVEDGDPLAFATVYTPSGDADLWLPVAHNALRPTRCLFFTGLERPSLVATVRCEPSAAHRLELQLQPANEPWPGSAVQIRLTRPDGTFPPDDTPVYARLDDGRQSGAAYGFVAPHEHLVRAQLEMGGPHEAILPADGVDTQQVDTELLLDTTLRDTFFAGTPLWHEITRLKNGSANLHVPEPHYRGHFRLQVVALDPLGGASVAEALLATPGRVHLELALPTPLTVGDRALGALEILNERSDAIKSTSTITTPPGLRIDAYRVADGPWVTVERAPLVIPLQLAASSEVRVLLRFVAEAATEGDVSASVYTGADTSGELLATAQAAAVAVLPKAVPTPDTAAVTVFRTIIVRTPQTNGGGTGHRTDDDFGTRLEQPLGANTPRVWRQETWRPGMVLRPGQLLHVIEQVDAAAITGELRWRQRVPATCQPASFLPIGGRSNWQRGPDDGDALTFVVRPGPSHNYEWEYVLAVVRPGDCALPTPAGTKDNDSFQVRTDPGVVRLLVEEVP